MKSPRRRSVGLLGWTGGLSAALLSCSLDTTVPGDLPHFAPAWQLVAIDGQPLPDTVVFPDDAAGTPHRVNAGAVEFFFPSGTRAVRWTILTQVLADTLQPQFARSFDAVYFQFGADSIAFPLSRIFFPEFFGSKVADTLTIVTIWQNDLSSPAAAVGGSHSWRFVRDTLIVE
jgi:hypothetical protein